jgi:hypothetical protein
VIGSPGLEGRDVAILGLGREEQADDEGHERDHDWVPESIVDVAGGGRHCERGGGGRPPSQPLPTWQGKDMPA